MKVSGSWRMGAVRGVRVRDGPDQCPGPAFAFLTGRIDSPSITCGFDVQRALGEKDRAEITGLGMVVAAEAAKGCSSIVHAVPDAQRFVRRQMPET